MRRGGGARVLGGWRGACSLQDLWLVDSGAGWFYGIGYIHVRRMDAVDMEERGKIL